jgi:hypothetical protein
VSARFFGRMSNRDRRAILLGLAVLAPAFLWIAAVRPYRETLAETRAVLDTERALLAREEALLAAAPMLPAALATAEEAVARAELRLVRAPNAPLGEAEVTSYLQDMAGLSRVLLQEMRGLEPDPDAAPPEDVAAFRLAVRGESDLQGVMTFLHRVEESPLLLRIVEVSMEPVIERPRTSRRRNDDDDDENQSNEPIVTGVVEFALVVEAYTPPTTGEPPSNPREVSRENTRP